MASCTQEGLWLILNNSSILLWIKREIDPTMLVAELELENKLSGPMFFEEICKSLTMGRDGGTGYL